MTDKVIILTTCATHADALGIARTLVERRLAACVNIVPNITSVYQWHGAIEESAEWLLVIKSATGLLENLKAELPKIHPYEVPELVALNILDGSESYLNWLTAELDRPVLAKVLDSPRNQASTEAAELDTANDVA